MSKKRDVKSKKFSEKHGKIIAIIGFFLGIIGLISMIGWVQTTFTSPFSSFLPWLFRVAVISMITSIFLSVVVLTSKKNGKGIAISGLIISIIALLFIVLILQELLSVVV